MKLHTTLAAIATALLCTAAQAQGTTPAPSSPAKKALVAQVLQLQQPGIEGVARLLIEQPSVQMMQAARQALSRVAAERRDAVAQDIQADVRKFVEENVPPVRERALKLAPSTIGAMLEERFSEDELRQLIAVLESPVNRKFQGMGPEMQRALVDKLAAEFRPTLDPKFRALQQGIAGRLGVTPAAAGASR